MAAKKALKEVVFQATQSLAHDTAVVAYANDIEGAETLKKSLLEHEDVDHVLIMPLGPVIFCPRRTRNISRLFSRKRSKIIEKG